MSTKAAIELLEEKARQAAKRPGQKVSTERLTAFLLRVSMLAQAPTGTSDDQDATTGGDAEGVPAPQ